MPKNVNDVNKRSTQTPQQCRSVGLAAYWKRMRCEAAEETNHPSGTEKLGYVAEDGALTERLEGSSKSVKGVKMINTETFDGQDAYVGVGVARSVEYCKSGIQNTPLFPSTSAVKGIISECHFAGEGGSNDPTKWMRALSFGKDIHFGSNPFLNTTPHIVENGGKLVVDKGKAAVSAVPTPSQTGKRILEHVECHEDLVSEKQMPSYTQPHNSVNACRKVNILSGHYSKAYNWGKFTKVQMPVGMSRSCSEIFNTKPYAGSNFTASNKAFNVESNTGKVGHMQPSNKLPPLPGAATSSNKSREAEKLLQHGKQPDLSNADPGNRSLKRLKLNSSTPSAQGTRCSNFASPLLLPPLPGAATSSEKSREVEKLLLHGEQPHLPNADPGNRLLKRLKLNSSTPSAQGTTSSLKISKLYGGIPRSSTTSSAPNKPEKQHGKKPVWSDEKGDLWNKGEEHIMENPKENRRALLLSHAWIKRWLPNEQGTTGTNPEAEANRDPQSSKLSAEKLQEKKFPSIEAMAQMGRVLTCSLPCELAKSGSYTIWKAF